MSAIRVEETTAVRAPLLDDFLRGNRTLRDGLFTDGFGRWFAVSTGYLRTCRGSTSFTVS